MSDTDDTDLLLLIPPDFFLIRSPDLEGFDSDSDITFEHAEIKDAIVSDLITQVNDLESRICMIENIERTSTRCSTCNDDSLINQSVNSLTESDITRAQIKEKRDILKRGLVCPGTPLMVKSFEEDCENIDDSLLESRSGLQKLNRALSNVIPNRTDIDDSSKPNGKHIENQNKSFDCSQNQDRANHQKSFGLEAQLSKEKQTQLLNEVDSFLENKILHLVQGNVSEGRELDINSQEIISDTGNNVSEADDLPLSTNNFDLEIDIDKDTQSLALTEVYKLISEMEETQSEMQRKLKIKDTQLPSQFQDKNNEMSLASRHMTSFSKMQNSKGPDLEELYSNSPKPLFNKQPEEVLEKLKLFNPQTNLLAQIPTTNEEKSYQRSFNPKSVSPNRTSVGYNPIDIVKANLPVTRKDDRGVQFGEGKDFSNRNTSFRRQLSFDKPHSPLRTSKSRPSLDHQRMSSQNDNQGKSDSDKLNAHLPHRTGSRSNHSLEEKFNTLTVQRASGMSNKEDQNTRYGLLKKPSTSSEVLQQKISSNNLLSLSELWNKEPTFYSDDPNKLRQKLEEERYRRQHCEQQIQALQVRVLEEQEKLAVAIKVDQEKDKAIMQITESWKKLNEHWGELEEQRHSLAQQLQAERESSKLKSEELTKKVERWEKEVSQALDLAAGYKEKSEAVQKQMESVKTETEEKLRQAENQQQHLNEQNEKLNDENNSLSDQLRVLQQRIKEEEELLSKLKAELEKSRKRLLEFEAENSVLKEQKVTLTAGIKEERNRITILEQKSSSLQQALNEACKKEKAAQEEARMSNERIEVARTELRALYQGQLETVVKEKLQEFQAQLETAEAALKAELHSKEKQWVEKANDQYRQLHDKYKRDLHRVEEIHKGEINNWKEKLKESERLRVNIEKKLLEEADRRADIAQRLHSVMETQWREALNIISNPMQGMYEMPKEENKNRRPTSQQSPERLQGKGDVRVSRSNSASSLVQGDEVPFSREGMVTYRTPQAPQDHQLKKYIQMLLERGPGNPVPPHDATLQDSSDPAYHQDNSLFNRRMERVMADSLRDRTRRVNRLGDET